MFTPSGFITSFANQKLLYAELTESQYSAAAKTSNVF